VEDSKLGDFSIFSFSILRTVFVEKEVATRIVIPYS
jgi:hypothetical protein